MNASTRARLRRLNLELSAVTSGAYHDRACPSVIWTAVQESGFKPEGLDRPWQPEEDGRASVEIGEGISLHLTWHKMEVTGRFEVVAYAN